MRKQLVLHFGIHRTGSTSIQKTLLDNKGKLASMGYCYPSLFNQQGHSKAAWLLINNKITSRDLIIEIKKNIPESSHTVILSAEDFCLLKNYEFIGELSKHYDVKLFIYVKDQVKWLESWYNQHIKWPWNKKFSSAKPSMFVSSVKDFYWIKYDDFLKRITKHINKDSISVKVSSKEHVPNTVSDFIASIGININDLVVEKEYNASLSFAKLQVLRAIDIYELNAPHRVKVLRAIDSLTIGEDNGSKHIFNHQECSYIKDYFCSSNTEFFKDYFNGQRVFNNLSNRDDSITYIPDDKIYRVYLPQVVHMLAIK